MKWLLTFGLLFGLSNCGDSDFFRKTEITKGASGVDVGDSGVNDDPAANPDAPAADPNPGKKDCVPMVQGDVKGLIKPDDIMRAENYDVNRLDDFYCDNDKLIFCHVPPGSYPAAHFIEISDSDSAIRTHFEKYDTDENGDIQASYMLKCEVFEELKLKLDMEYGCGVICK
ncbi:MAG: hypothetical protein H6621_09305 [Halobacteriovoraceae bacterium]|nr:hypothetical protein [Halobacteriovoraceae bacterium]MCB9095252.1 hypothetical protein [Halobacteriovoraceae bacterium]